MVAARGSEEALTARRYDHVVFDLDGTLVDSAADIAAAANYTRARYGAGPLPVRTVWRHVGHGVHDLVTALLPGLAAAELENAIGAYRAYYAQHLLDATRAFPGIDEALRTLATAGVTLSLLTNKPEAMARAIVRGLGLEARFSAVVGGDTVARRKPDPAGLVEIARRTGVAPARMLLVGDSTVDRDTARVAAVDFCVAAWGVAGPGLEAELRCAGRPSQLVALVLGD